MSYFSLLVLLSWCYRRCCHSGETPLSHETWFSQTTLRCKVLKIPRTYLCVHRAFPFKLLELLRKPNASILSGKTTKWKMCRVLIYLFQGRVPNGFVVVQGTLNTTNARRRTKQSNWSRPQGHVDRFIGPRGTSSGPRVASVWPGRIVILLLQMIRATSLEIP